MELFIPYAKDEGIISMIHSLGLVRHIEYNDKGTIISCRVPQSLILKLKSFEINQNSV